MVYHFTAEAEDVAGHVGTDAGSFELIVTLESLLSTLEQLCEDGEIANPGNGQGNDICNALAAKLNAANNSHDRGNINAMCGVLNAFLQQLNAQQGNAVSQAAYDLLYQDVRFVIEQFCGTLEMAAMESLFETADEAASTSVPGTEASAPVEVTEDAEAMVIAPVVIQPLEVAPEAVEPVGIEPEEAATEAVSIEPVVVISEETATEATEPAAVAPAATEAETAETQEANPPSEEAGENSSQ